MSKVFSSRVSKKERRTIDISSNIDKDIIKKNDDRLLDGARLLEIKLTDIKVKEQVRTKFNDHSLRDLSDNIQANGLIQPLVVYLENNQYTLVCGERRFRAMTLIDFGSCPCFVLENKTDEELMAIQFSENSAREALHYIDKADGILNYQIATKASERKITKALGISKSEVHRSLMIAKLTKTIKEAAKKYDIEKYVLVEYDALESGTFKKKIHNMIIAGEVIKRSKLKRILKDSHILSKGKKVTSRKKPAIPAGVTANAFLKIMEKQSKTMELDIKTQAALKALLNDTKELMDF